MERGNSFMSNKRYHDAKSCYQNAQYQEWTEIADAFILEQTAEELARSVQSSEKDRAKAAFRHAGDAFVALPHDPDWARHGGICYARAGDHRKSGIAFLSVPAYAEAAQQFWQCGDFDALYSILLRHKVYLKPEDAQRMVDRLKLHFLKVSDYEWVLLSHYGESFLIRCTGESALFLMPKMT